MEALIRIQKELKAAKNQFNKFGGYKYRSAEDIEEAVKPLLQGAVLTLSDEVILVGSNVGCTLDQEGNLLIYTGRVYIRATATLLEGDQSVSVAGWAREQDARKGMDAAQVTGSASSYARKYALSGLFLCTDTQDPDQSFGDGAAWDAPSQAQQPATPPTTPPTQAQQPATAPPQGQIPAPTAEKKEWLRPTPEQRKWLKMLWDYYIYQSEGRLKLEDHDAMRKLMKLCELHYNRYPGSMSDVDQMKRCVKAEELFV